MERAPDIRRWVDREWYRHLAWRLGPDGLFAVSIIALAVLAVCGALTMRALAGGGGGQASASYIPLETTVMRRVAVVRRGKTVYRRVPVVQRIYAQPVTVQETRLVHTPGGTKVVTEPVVRFRRVTDTRVLTNTRLLTDTRLLTVTNPSTSTVVNEHTSTVVNEHTNTVVNTVVNQQTVNQTVTNVRTETSPPETVTVTGPTETVVQPTTVEVTVTLPVTVTVGRDGG